MPVKVEVLDDAVPETDVPRLFMLVFMGEALRYEDDNPVTVGPWEEVVFDNGYGTVDSDVDEKITEEVRVLPDGPMVIEVNETPLPVGLADDVELKTGYGIEVLDAECEMLD